MGIGSSLPTTPTQLSATSNQTQAAPTQSSASATQIQNPTQTVAPQPVGGKGAFPQRAMDAFQTAQTMPFQQPPVGQNLNMPTFPTQGGFALQPPPDMLQQQQFGQQFLQQPPIQPPMQNAMFQNMLTGRPIDGQMDSSVENNPQVLPPATLAPQPSVGGTMEPMRQPGMAPQTQLGASQSLPPGMANRPFAQLPPGLARRFGQQPMMQQRQPRAQGLQDLLQRLQARKPSV